jgi:hypothetical protein
MSVCRSRTCPKAPPHALEGSTSVALQARSARFLLIPDSGPPSTPPLPSISSFSFPNFFGFFLAASLIAGAFSIVRRPLPTTFDTLSSARPSPWAICPECFLPGAVPPCSRCLFFASARSRSVLAVSAQPKCSSASDKILRQTTRHIPTSSRYVRGGFLSISPWPRARLRGFSFGRAFCNSSAATN